MSARRAIKPKAGLKGSLKVMNAVLGLSASMTSAGGVAYDIANSEGSSKVVYTYNISFVNVSQSVINFQNYNVDNSFILEVPNKLAPEDDCELVWVANEGNPTPYFTLNFSIGGVPIALKITWASTSVLVSINGSQYSPMINPISIEPQKITIQDYTISYAPVGGQGGNITFLIEGTSRKRAIPAVLPLIVSGAAQLIANGSTMASIASNITKSTGSSQYFTYHFRFINNSDTAVEFTRLMATTGSYITQFPFIIYPDNLGEFVWFSKENCEIGWLMNITGDDNPLTVYNNSDQEVLKIAFNGKVTSTSYPTYRVETTSNGFTFSFMSISVKGGTVEILIES